MLALVIEPFDSSPGQRFRIEQWEPHLAKCGIHLEYAPLLDHHFRQLIYRPGHFVSKFVGAVHSLLRRALQAFRATSYDAIYIYRTANIFGPAWLEYLLHLTRTPIIYDFDDAIWLTNTSKANRMFGWAKFAGKTGTISRLSTCVTVGNSFLAEYASRFNNDVVIVPTSIDTELYVPRASYKTENRIVVGWTGSSTSQYHLEDFENVLAKLKRIRDVEVRVISDRMPDFRQIDATWRPWTSDSEVVETAMIDVGIMPIPDDDWSRGKCGAKALQYMALGIPSVCSNVGANKDIIEHGVNGFLAGSEDDWLKFLTSLIDDCELRTRIGKAGRNTVEKDYSAYASAAKFASAVKRVVKYAD